MPYLIPGQSIAAVDAPLVVPNPLGMRRCERLIGQKFGAMGCGAYPAHQGNMAGTRGPRLLSYLVEKGNPVFVGPSMTSGHPCIHFMETYPHASHLALFGLPSVWKYKKKAGRTWDSCRAELTNYWRCLYRILPGVSEQIVEMAVTDPLAGFLKEWIQAIHGGTEPPDVIGVRYKEFEDLTDGLFCAYVAAHLHAGRSGLLFSPYSPGLQDLSHYEQGQDFIVVPCR